MKKDELVVLVIDLLEERKRLIDAIADLERRQKYKTDFGIKSTRNTIKKSRETK